MGEYAEMMLDGTCCASCGEWLGGSGDGFAVYCANCAPDFEKPKPKKTNETAYQCPVCGKGFRGKLALIQHLRDKQDKNHEAARQDAQANGMVSA